MQRVCRQDWPLRSTRLLLQAATVSCRPRSAAAVEHREPDGGGAGGGPFHAVAVMRRDVQAIARRQQAGMALVLEAQAGGATEQHDPFALGLVVPETGRAGLAAGNDTLNTHTWAAEQLVDPFGAGGVARGQGSQQVGRDHGKPRLEGGSSTMDAIAARRAS